MRYTIANSVYSEKRTYKNKEISEFQKIFKGKMYSRHTTQRITI